MQMEFGYPSNNSVNWGIIDGQFGNEHGMGFFL